MAETTEIDLPSELLQAISKVDQEAQLALATVGEAHLANEDAQRVAARARAQLELAMANARRLIAERDKTIAKAVATITLPDGEWTLDRERGKLVRRTS